MSSHAGEILENLRCVSCDGGKILGYRQEIEAIRGRAFNRGRRDYYVLLHWLNKENRWDVFMLSGRTAFIEVCRGERNQGWKTYHKTSTKVVSKIALSKKNQGLANRWRRKWESWTL
jgi:hypothetical protein